MVKTLQSFRIIYSIVYNSIRYFALLTENIIGLFSSYIVYVTKCIRDNFKLFIT